MIEPKTDLDLARAALAKAEEELERSQKALDNAEAASAEETTGPTTRREDPR